MGVGDTAGIGGHRAWQHLADSAVGVQRPHHFDSWAMNLTLELTRDIVQDRREADGLFGLMQLMADENEASDGDPDPVVRLALIEGLTEALPEWEADAVGKARAVGLSWERIALLLGRSKRAVWQPHGPGLPEYNHAGWEPTEG